LCSRMSLRSQLKCWHFSLGSPRSELQIFNVNHGVTPGSVHCEDHQCSIRQKQFCNHNVSPH
jgi:hypothetical protein